MPDYERIVKEVGQSRLVFQPHGSRIIELTLAGHTISGVVTRGDGSEASTHPCSPNFDQDTAGFGLPRHGVMRNSQVVVRAERNEDIDTHIKLSGGSYPEGLFVDQTYILTGRDLTIMTFHQNLGGKPMPINYGNHSYFFAPGGLEGVMLNGVNLVDAIRGDQVFRWELTNHLVIPGMPKLSIKQEGLPFVNPWTGQDAKGNYDRDYFSLSSIQGDHTQGYFGSPDSLLQPEAYSANRLTISLAAR